MRGLLRATATGLSWPNAFNTGATITAPTPSVTVPTPTTSGTGWSYTSGTVTVTGTVTGLNITGAVVISGSGASLSNSIVSGSVTLSGANTALTGSSAASVAINASGCSVTGCSIPPGGGIAVANASPATGTLISNCEITQIAGTLGGIRLGSGPPNLATDTTRSEEHTSELQSPCYLECRLLLERNQRDSRFGRLFDQELPVSSMPWDVHGT